MSSSNSNGSDNLDQAADMQNAMNNAGIAAAAFLVAPERHPLFDGESCIKCGSEIPRCKTCSRQDSVCNLLDYFGEKTVNDYLVALAAIVFIYFLGSFYFIYQRHEADAARKQNMQMAVEAMGNAIKSQQATIERLAAKATLEKGCK